jgi:cysteine sulfinate desulfinase/cysteine desulfurase-like protein
VIYLDHNATTPVSPEVFEGMRPYFCEEWGNPSSSYRFGSKLKSVIETAREQMAELIGAHPGEVLFTSCGMESNNAAIHAAIMSRPEKRHIITSQVEHSSVLGYCRTLERQGYRVTYLPVDRDEMLSLADLDAALDDLLSLYRPQASQSCSAKPFLEGCPSRSVVEFRECKPRSGKPQLETIKRHEKRGLWSKA